MQTRREFLRNTSLTLVSACAASPRAAWSQVAVATRRDVTTLAEDGPELEALRRGIAAMKASPTKYPLSWEGQAHIHRDTCPHGNWFFLPWHRAYLYFFEAICRDVSGDPNFVLPYWDWTKDRSIPKPFWDPTSPLFHSRAASAGDRARDEFVGAKKIDEILALRDFEIFGSARSSSLRPGVASGELEGTPHNYVHRFVGGDMATFLSPLDPIFWLHHANVDRLWTLWRNPQNTPTSSTWLDLEMGFFDTAGSPTKIQVRDLLSTDALGYRYDTPAFETRSTSAAGNLTVLEGESVPLDATLAVGERVTAEIPLGELAPSLNDAMTSGGLVSLRLSIDGVDVEGGRDFAVRVFLGDPEADASASVEDPHYLTSFTFFDDPKAGAHHGGPKAFYLDLGPALRERDHDPDRPIETTLVPVALPGGEKPGTVSVRGMSLSLVLQEEPMPLVG